MNEHTVHVMMTPLTSIMTCTLVPAFAGSCFSFININGKIVPTHVDVVTMANNAVAMANGPTKSPVPSGDVSNTRRKPALDNAAPSNSPT